MAVRPTRRTQPHRRGAGRTKGATLQAMKRGKPAYMANPQDTKRKLQKKAGKRRRKNPLRRVIRRSY